MNEVFFTSEADPDFEIAVYQLTEEDLQKSREEALQNEVLCNIFNRYALEVVDASLESLFEGMDLAGCPCVGPSAKPRMSVYWSEIDKEDEVVRFNWDLSFRWDQVPDDLPDLLKAFLQSLGGTNWAYTHSDVIVLDPLQDDYWFEWPVFGAPETEEAHELVKCVHEFLKPVYLDLLSPRFTFQWLLDRGYKYFQSNGCAIESYE